MGFNTEIRKALDDALPIRQRFGYLRGAVASFSPNGFNATLGNLCQAAEVSDPDRWTAEQIATAARLLSRSRDRYLRHRAMWDDERRMRKSFGGHCPSREELAAFGDRSWFDDISWAQKKRSYRWCGLREWVAATGTVAHVFGSDLEDESQQVLGDLPSALLPWQDPMVVAHGPFGSFSEPPNVMAIPKRVFNPPIADADYDALSSEQRLMVDCWYSRSNDGYVRERHLQRIIEAQEHWVVPYVLAALGDYVVEIVQCVATGVKMHDKPGSWHHFAYRDFIANNHDFVYLVRQRASSYHNEHYSASFARSGGRTGRPVYPAFQLLDQLTARPTYQRQYRLPSK